MSSKGDRISWKCLVSTCMSEFIYWDAQRCTKKRQCPVCGERNYMTLAGYNQLKENGQLDQFGNVNV